MEEKILNIVEVYSDKPLKQLLEDFEWYKQKYFESIDRLVKIRKLINNYEKFDRSECIPPREVISDLKDLIGGMYE